MTHKAAPPRSSSAPCSARSRLRPRAPGSNTAQTARKAKAVKTFIYGSAGAAPVGHLPMRQNPSNLRPRSPCPTTPYLLLFDSFCAARTQPRHLLRSGRSRTCVRPLRRLGHLSVQRFDGILEDALLATHNDEGIVPPPARRRLRLAFLS